MKRTALLILAPFSAAVCLQAQTLAVGGTVRDTTGALISKASVEFRQQDTGVRRQTFTNKVGVYEIAGLKPGVFDITVRFKGFQALTQQNVVLHVDDNDRINFVLKVGDENVSVVVDGGQLQINQMDATVSTVIDRKFVEGLPLNGRSLQDLISLTPGIVTQTPQNISTATLGGSGDFSVNGQRADANYYTLDGVSANAGSGDGSGQPQSASGGGLPSSTALGTSQSLISIDALQEFRVSSSTYSAEYGRSPGGQFAFNSRSGTKTFHGTVFDFLRNNYFDANDWFNDYYGVPTAALRQNDFGGTLGGPLYIPFLSATHDKTFFFASYEGLRLSQPLPAALTYVPDTYMRTLAATVLQPLPNAFPVQNGLDYGTAAAPSLARFISTSSSPSSIDASSLRFDQTIGDTMSVFVRASYSPSYTQSRSQASLTRFNVSSQAYTLGVTNQLSSHITNELRLGATMSISNASRVGDTYGGANGLDLNSYLGLNAFRNPNPQVAFYFSGVGSAQVEDYNTSNHAQQWNLVDNVTWSIGHHVVKVGFDYRHIRSPLAPPDMRTYSEYDSNASVESNSSDYTGFYRSLPAVPIFNQVAAYVQDEWRVVPSVSVSAGLRWDYNPPPHEANGNDAYTTFGDVSNLASLTLAPRGTALWEAAKYNFAPRLGVAWTANNAAGMETVFRTGGGVYFDNDDNIATQGYSQSGFYASNSYSGYALPFAASDLNLSTALTTPYEYIFAYPRHLQLPYTIQWNVSLEQGLGKGQTLTTSYVASNSRRQTFVQEIYAADFNPLFGSVSYVQPHITANYQSLQVKYQRSLVRGVQALASYTWSHGIDFGSNSSVLEAQRGNSDYDVRHNLQVGVGWNIPGLRQNSPFRLLTNNWGMDTRFMARTAFPVTLLGDYLYDTNTGITYTGGLDLDPSVPLYLYGSQYPGGRSINPAAFTDVSTGVGNAPRNFARGFGAQQFNVSAHKTFPLARETSIEFRAETFNLFNHPNFGYVDQYLFDSTFGQAGATLSQSLSTVAAQYQQGGSRSMQFSLKLRY